jgi:hypothetical protein
MINPLALSNEEKFVLADEAARKLEEELGRKLSPAEYENFVWRYMQDLHHLRLERLE